MFHEYELSGVIQQPTCQALGRYIDLELQFHWHSKRRMVKHAKFMNFLLTRILEFWRRDEGSQNGEKMHVNFW